MSAGFIQVLQLVAVQGMFECSATLWHNAWAQGMSSPGPSEDFEAMLLQTNSYIVPRDRQAEHARILRRFRQTLIRLGCDHFEVYQQVGANWSTAEPSGRFVQIMRFRDRKHQLAVQAAERTDPAAQALLKEFCELINLPYQQQQGIFASGYYMGFLRMPSGHLQSGGSAEEQGIEPYLDAQGQVEGEEAASGEEATATEESEQGAEAAESEELVQAEGSTESAEEADSDEETPDEETSPINENQAEESPVTSADETSIPESTADLSEVAEAGASSETSESSPELEIREPMVSDDEPAPDLERVAEEGISPADANEDELNTEARNEIPAEADGLDSESVFLGALDGDLEDPSSIRPLASDEDAEADTEKPTSPFNS